MEHPHLFERHQPALHHLVERGEKAFNFTRGIDDFDDDGQIHGEPEYFCRVQAAGFAKAHRATQNRRPGQVHFPCFEHNGLEQWLLVPPIAFAQVNAQTGGLVRELHTSSFHRVKPQRKQVP